jgi:hypothetical protein
MRFRRVVAVLALIGSLTFATGMLISAGGCSGSSQSGAPATQDEEAQKIGQAKMKEYMANKAASKGQKKR